MWTAKIENPCSVCRHSCFTSLRGLNISRSAASFETNITCRLHTQEVRKLMMQRTATHREHREHHAARRSARVSASLASKPSALCLFICSLSTSSLLLSSGRVALKFFLSATQWLPVRCVQAALVSFLCAIMQLCDLADIENVMAPRLTSGVGAPREWRRRICRHYSPVMLPNGIAQATLPIVIGILRDCVRCLSAPWRFSVTKRLLLLADFGALSCATLTVLCQGVKPKYLVPRHQR